MCTCLTYSGEASGEAACRGWPWGLLSGTADAWRHTVCHRKYYPSSWSEAHRSTQVRAAGRPSTNKPGSLPGRPSARCPGLPAVAPAGQIGLLTSLWPASGSASKRSTCTNSARCKVKERADTAQGRQGALGSRRELCKRIRDYKMALIIA